MLRRSFTLLLALLAAPVASRAGPVERASSAVAVFASYCLGGLPDFSALDRRAAAAGLAVYLDRSIPMDADRPIRQKHWVVPDPSGALLLTADDAVHGPLHVVGCGLFVTDTLGPEMERALSARLGNPVHRGGDTKQGATVSWRPQLGPLAQSADVQVLLAYDVPGLQGVSVDLIYRKRNNP